MQQNQNNMMQGEGKKNILLPLPKDMHVNQFYKYTQMEVPVDISERSGDIFKVGSFKGSDEQWVNTFSLTKPLLMKLAVAAGVQFDPMNTGGEYIGKNCYKGKAYGAILQADGTSKTHFDEKVINLEDEEDNFRLEFLNKSLEGITDQKQAKEAAKLFRGEWRQTENKWRKSVQGFFVDSMDREAYIDRGVLVNMILLRKTMAEKALTGAQLRVIRSLLGVKSGYTKEELSVPFLIPRVTFAPDYKDPQVKSAMIDRGLNAATAMFGGATQQLSSSLVTMPSYDVTTIMDSQDDIQDIHEIQVMDVTPSETSGQAGQCSLCHCGMTHAQVEESMNHTGQIICVSCFHEGMKG